MLELLRGSVGRRRSKRARNEVAMPWEGRSAWARQLLAGKRWKLLLLFLALVWIGYEVYATGERTRRVRQTYGMIAEVRKAIARFQLEVGRCPRSMTELVHPPRSRSRYLREVPKDGWGRAIWVRCPAHDDPDGVDVLSAGPSGSFTVDDNLQ